MNRISVNDNSGQKSPPPHFSPQKSNKKSPKLWPVIYRSPPTRCSLKEPFQNKSILFGGKWVQRGHKTAAKTNQCIYSEYGSTLWINSLLWPLAQEQSAPRTSEQDYRWLRSIAPCPTTKIYFLVIAGLFYRWPLTVANMDPGLAYLLHLIRIYLLRGHVWWHMPLVLTMAYTLFVRERLLDNALFDSYPSPLPRIKRRCNDPVLGRLIVCFTHCRVI